MEAINTDYYGRLFYFCLREALEYEDPDAYVSDVALSSAWEDGDYDGEKEIEIDFERVNWLHTVWEAAHRSIKDILKTAHMTQKAFCECFGIPRRTVENWCSGTNECPFYTNILIQEHLGLISRDYAVKTEKINKLKQHYEAKKTVLRELGYEADNNESWDDIIEDNENKDYLTENEFYGKHVLWYLDSSNKDVIYDLDEDRLLNDEEIKTFLKRFEDE